MCSSLRDEIFQLTTLFGAEHHTPIILSAKPPDYPSIGELDYGLSLTADPRPLIIYRHFGSSEIIFRTLDGWRNLRKVLIKYYKAKNSMQTSSLPLKMNLESDLNASIMEKVGKDRKSTLVIELKQSDLKAFVFPRSISLLAEQIFDQIDDDVVKIFNSKIRAQVLMNNLTDALCSRNEVAAVKAYKKSLQFDENDKICTALLESKNLKTIGVWNKKKKRVAVGNTSPTQEIVSLGEINSIPETPQKKRGKLLKKN